MMQRKKIFWWVTVILWCLLIAFATRNPFFTGSSTEQLLSNSWFFDSKILNIILRKTGHMVAFGILAVLSWNALGEKKYRFFIAWVIATFYGAVDEWHQSFIPNRDGVFTDVLYNSTGALLALISIKLFFGLKKKRNSR